MKWLLEIEDKFGNLRRYVLDHEYDFEDETIPTAEKMADELYTEDDIAWSVKPIMDKPEILSDNRKINSLADLMEYLSNW